MKTIYGIIFITSLLIITGCDDKNGPKGNPDETFAINAANANRAEIDIGILAREHGDNQETRDYAIMLVTDHTASLGELTTLAAQKEFTLPTNGLTADAAALKQRLMGLSGFTFDTAYLNAQIKGHEAVINMYQDEAENGGDDEIKAYASNSLPKLTEHWNKAKEVREHVIATQVNAGRIKPE